MKTQSTSHAARVRHAGVPSEPGGILSMDAVEDIQPLARALLLPEEEQLSLPPRDQPSRGALTSLTHYLGPHLTVASPAWSGDPVPKMRALQKLLVERSLTLEQDERTEYMDAIVQVENAIQLRLRFQQMRDVDAEQDTRPVEESAK